MYTYTLHTHTCILSTQLYNIVDKLNITIALNLYLDNVGTTQGIYTYNMYAHEEKGLKLCVYNPSDGYNT